MLKTPVLPKAKLGFLDSLKAARFRAALLLIIICANLSLWGGVLQHLRYHVEHTHKRIVKLHGIRLAQCLNLLDKAGTRHIRLRRI